MYIKIFAKPSYEEIFSETNFCQCSKGRRILYNDQFRTKYKYFAMAKLTKIFSWWKFLCTACGEQLLTSCVCKDTVHLNYSSLPIWGTVEYGHYALCLYSMHYALCWHSGLVSGHILLISPQNKAFTQQRQRSYELVSQSMWVGEWALILGSHSSVALIILVTRLVQTGINFN